ncbi:3994_t:CDS:2, partial [Gigaspora rosea]
KELDKLARQETWEGRATRVDQFCFLGGEQKFNETHDSDDIEILNDQEDSYSRDETLFEPCTIIRSGFRNSKLIDEAMLHLYLKNKFDVPNKKTQNNINILHYNSNEQFRSAYENDDNNRTN